MRNYHWSLKFARKWECQFLSRWLEIPWRPTHSINAVLWIIWTNTRNIAVVSEVPTGWPRHRENREFGSYFLGGLSLHLNHLIASRMANYDWPFGTLSFGLFGSNLDTRHLETYPRTYSGHFWNMSIFDDCRAIWVLFKKWVVSENQSFLDEGVIITPLSV